MPGSHAATKASASTGASRRNFRFARSTKAGGLTILSTMIEPVLQKLTRAPGNNEPIGGLTVTTRNGWFAARPSGTENLYKLYAESFNGPDHLRAIIEEAQQIVAAATRGA